MKQIATSKHFAEYLERKVNIEKFLKVCHFSAQLLCNAWLVLVAPVTQPQFIYLLHDLMPLRFSAMYMPTCVEQKRR